MIRTYSVMRQFKDKSNQPNIDDFSNYIIPLIFLDLPESFILIELPFCENNEIKIKHFLKKFHRFTKESFEVAIKYKTRKVKTFFYLITHLSILHDLKKYLFMCRNLYRRNYTQCFSIMGRT